MKSPKPSLNMCKCACAYIYGGKTVAQTLSSI